MIPWLHLVIAAMIWVGAYSGLRAPRRVFGQFRESPSFDPKSRLVAIVWATIAAGLFMAYALFAA